MKKLERLSLSSLKFEPLKASEMTKITGGYYTDNTSNSYVGASGDCHHNGDGAGAGQYYTGWGGLC